MKKKIFLFVIAAVTAFKVSSCEFGIEEEIPDIQAVTITGQVAESISGNPIFNASIRITDDTNQVNTTTNSEGKFTAKFELTEDKELTIIAFKEGYSTDTLKFFATVGTTITVPLIQIKQIQGTGGSSSGGPASIYMFSQSA